MKTILNHSRLVSLFQDFGIPEPGQNLVLFAVRGALPAVTRHTWSVRCTLKHTRVDYRHLRCTLGIWDRVGKKLLLAPGSTVPHIEQVEAAARRGGRGANQLEPGYYTDYIRGEHLEGKPRGHLALRQSAFRFIRRSANGAPYGSGDPLRFSNPFDNLHCAWNPRPERPGFSSAGCLVVAGWPHAPRLPGAKPEYGHWKFFRRALYATHQAYYPLLLLKAEQVKTALEHGGNAPLLCYGSQGEAVKSLQRELKARGLYKGRATGRLDARTYRAWNKASFQY